MSTAGFPIPNPRFKCFVAGTDAPLAGGFVQFYLTGTTTPQDVFAEIACITPLTNPVQLDVNGEAEIYGNAVYDILVYDSTMVLQYTMLGISFAPADTSTTTTSQEWIAITGTPTYLSSTSFTVAVDQTSTFHTGRRVRAIITGGTIIYGTVVSSSYTVSTTVVVSFDSGTLDSGLSSVKVGILDSRTTSIPTLTPLPTTGAGNPAYTLTIQGGAPIAGVKFRAIINSTFTVIGGPATLNVNGTGDKPIKKLGTVNLSSGDLKIGEIHDFEYDGTNYQLLNHNIINSEQFVPNTIDAAALANATVTQTQVANSAIGYPQLKIAQGTVSGPNGRLKFNRYSFAPAFFGGSNMTTFYTGADDNDYIANGFASGAGNSWGARWDYITSSDNSTIWVAYDKDGKIVGAWMSDDALPNNVPGMQPEDTSLLVIQIPREDLGIMVPICSLNSIAEGNKKATTPDRAAYHTLYAEYSHPPDAVIAQCKIVNGKLTLK